jgi:hypothetical protein
MVERECWVSADVNQQDMSFMYRQTLICHRSYTLPAPMLWMDPDPSIELKPDPGYPRLDFLRTKVRKKCTAEKYNTFLDPKKPQKFFSNI